MFPLSDLRIAEPNSSEWPSEKLTMWAELSIVLYCGSNSLQGRFGIKILELSDRTKCAIYLLREVQIRSNIWLSLRPWVLFKPVFQMGLKRLGKGSWLAH